MWSGLFLCPGGKTQRNNCLLHASPLKISQNTRIGHFEGNETVKNTAQPEDRGTLFMSVREGDSKKGEGLEPVG